MTNSSLVYKPSKKEWKQLFKIASNQSIGQMINVMEALEMDISFITEQFDMPLETLKKSNSKRIKHFIKSKMTKKLNIL